MSYPRGDPTDRSYCRAAWRAKREDGPAGVVCARGSRREVPISYAGREFNEGKKISWKDGFVVLFTLLRYRLLP